MKNSGIDWIGMIPNDWCVEKGKHVFAQRNTKGNETPVLLAATQKSGMIPQSLLEGVVQVKLDTDLQTFKTVHVGDFVISLRSFQGGFEMSDYEGVCSPAYQVFYSTQDIFHKYYKYLFKSYGFISKMNSLVVGIREGKNIQYKDFAESMLPIPPLPTQQRIANFLDRKCAEIDELAALQEAMIAELKRYKQSVITEAVTKGLDPNVPMKDSGVEWLGNIPKGWEVKKVKNVTTAITKGNGITKEEVFVDGDTPCIRYGEIYSKYDNSFVTCMSKTKKDVLSTLHYFGNGDILCAGTGELVEEIGKSIVYLGENQCLAGGDIIVLSHNQNPLFLNFALNSKYAQAQKSCSKAKLKVVHISAYDIGSVLIAFPSLTEQCAIADYLDKKCAEIDELIAIKQQKIEALKEYKKSVIFEYVTGKKEIEK